MTPDLLTFLPLILAGGAAVVLTILAIRLADQRRRDIGRDVSASRYPRNVSEDQEVAVVRTMVGLARATTGLSGRDSVALEVIGTVNGITFRQRLPANASSYLIAQQRAAVPGLAVETIEDFRPEKCSQAIELARRITQADLAVTDMAAVSRTILAALTGLRRGERVEWQIVFGGGISERPEEWSLWTKLGGKQTGRPERRRADIGVVGATIRIGAVASTPERARELVNRLRRAAASVSAPGARLRRRAIPSWLVVRRLAWAATPITAAAVPLTVEELTALSAPPVGTPMVPGLILGGSPQLPPVIAVPRVGRVLGRATATGRSVAQPIIGAREHSLLLGPTGSGKSWLAVQLILGDIAAGRGGLLIDPKGSTAKLVIERMDENAIGRTVICDLTDDKMIVPLPLLTSEAGGIPELAADTIVALLRHRYRDLGPRSSDILASSLYALARTPEPAFIDLLRLWSDTAFRASVTSLVHDDPVLMSFFGWFNGLNPAERAFVLAAPMNKIRPLLQRASVRNVLGAPRATFTMAQALKEKLIVIVILPEGVLGKDATTLVGQVVLARLWAAVQARSGRAFYPVTIDEAPRFLDQPTDLGEVLARSREYGVGMTLIGQGLRQFPESLREVALNSARTKIAFGTSATDARRLAEEFGPGVEADFFTGLARFEAIGAVSLGGTVSPPFTFATEALGPAIPGRAQEVRRASRERFGIPREEIEAAIRDRQKGGTDRPGPDGGRNEDVGLSARVSGRCTNLMRFGLVRRSSEPVNGADVYAHEVGEMSGRVSWQRLALIRGQLIDRDWAVMEMLTCVKLANGNQLRRATSGDNSPAGQRAARRQLARLVEWRVVERLERRQGGLGRGSDAWTYALGPTGLRLSGDGSRARRPSLPSPPMWQHALMGAEIYTRLVEATRDGDRELALWQGEPDCWRDYPGPYGEQVRLKPDAFAIVSGPDYEDMAFVEFDTGSQSRAVMRAKLEAYRRYRASGQEQGVQDGVFPLVVIITSSPERQAMLLDLLTYLPTEDWQLFKIGQLADAARLLMGGAS